MVKDSNYNQQLIDISEKDEFQSLENLDSKNNLSPIEQKLNAEQKKMECKFF